MQKTSSLFSLTLSMSISNISAINLCFLITLHYIVLKSFLYEYFGLWNESSKLPLFLMGKFFLIYKCFVLQTWFWNKLFSHTKVLLPQKKSDFLITKKKKKRQSLFSITNSNIFCIFNYINYADILLFINTSMIILNIEYKIYATCTILYRTLEIQ